MYIYICVYVSNGAAPSRQLRQPSVKLFSTRAIPPARPVTTGHASAKAPSARLSWGGNGSRLAQEKSTPRTFFPGGGAWRKFIWDACGTSARAKSAHQSAHSAAERIP